MKKEYNFSKMQEVRSSFKEKKDIDKSEGDMSIAEIRHIIFCCNGEQSKVNESNYEKLSELTNKYLAIEKEFDDLWEKYIDLNEGRKNIDPPDRFYKLLWEQFRIKKEIKKLTT